MSEVVDKSVEKYEKGFPLLPSARAVKAMTCRVSLLALGVTFELTSKHVAEMQREIANWNEGRRIGLGVLPDGPHITIAFEGGRLHYLGAGLRDPHTSILFKNLDSAVMIFTGMLSAPRAVAECRVCVHGSTWEAMEATRAMAVVQKYLFPSFMLKQSFKRPPVFSREESLAKAKIMALLTPEIIKAASK